MSYANLYRRASELRRSFNLIGRGDLGALMDRCAAIFADACGDA